VLGDDGVHALELDLEDLCHGRGFSDLAGLVHVVEEIELEEDLHPKVYLRSIYLSGAVLTKLLRKMRVVLVELEVLVIALA
jgi:hypothetical protein